MRRTIFSFPIIDDICFHLSRRNLDKMMGTEEDMDSVLRTAYSYSGWGNYSEIRPNQHSEELRALVEILASRDVESIMEIGTDKGGTLYVLSRYLEVSDAISVDLHNERRRRLFELFTNGSMHVIQGNSHDHETKAAVGDIVGDEGLDFLLIDGDHSYEGVRSDFQMYEPLVSSGGVIAFHDITERPDGAWFDNGVHDFWTEIKDGYEHQELIQTTPATYEVPDAKRQERIVKYAGLGVLYV